MIHSPDAIDLDPERPLIICDADEVLFLFIEAFERYLGDHDHYLELSSFALTGNVKARATGLAVDGPSVGALLSAFFEAETENLLPVPGAADALAEASRFAQIVVLSNLPQQFHSARSACLKRHGMDFPLILWASAKGAPVAALSRRIRKRALFIDDLPLHHESVAGEAPEVIRLHMIADRRLRSLIGPAGHAHARHDDWPDALKFIRKHLQR